MPPKGKKPAHQNKVAFHHNKGSKKTARILSLPNQGLCGRCHEKIEWRKKYRKYKPLKAPAHWYVPPKPLFAQNILLIASL